MTYERSGRCPICEAPATFSSEGSWYRDMLKCSGCQSIPRERALALILNELRPEWRSLAIHESSPDRTRGISKKLLDAPGYIASQYFPDRQPGEIVWDVFRNENLEAMTFKDEQFDLTISLDVMEHVFEPEQAFKEIYRTLKPGGLYICTFPVRNYQVQAMERRCVMLPDGTRRDLKEPEIHGNPIGDGSIVTVDWGYNLHQLIATWVPMDVRVCRFDDATHGVIGEYTEVIVCRKQKR